MGSIVAMKKTENKKLIMEVLLEQYEALHLQGHTENIHLITDNVVGVPSRISLRGKNEATKYFLIPKILRDGIKLHYHNSTVTCQKISLVDKILFIYTISPFIGKKDELESIPDNMSKSKEINGNL